MAQINLSGSLGVPGSVPILGNYNVVFASDANHTMTATEWSNNFLEVTSGVSLTATRNLVAPLNQGQAFIVQNKTTGGQSIQIIGASGTGVTIVNGSFAPVICDGTNYLTATISGPAGGDLSGTYPNPTVAKIEGNPVQSVSLGSTQDGYVLTWHNSSSQNQWLPTGTPTTNVFTVTTASYSVSATDNVILANYSNTGVCNITLPSPATIGRKVTIIDISGNAQINPVNILPHAGELINGLGGDSIDINSNQIIVVSDGTNWWEENTQGLIITGGDVSGTTNGNNTLVSKISYGGTIPIVSNDLQFTSTTVAPAINQASTATGNGTSLTIAAQPATAGTFHGGNLVLSSGTSSGGNAGILGLQAGGVDVVDITHNQVQFKSSFGRQEANISSVKTSNYTINSGSGTDYIILVSTNASAVSITLPSSPSIGDEYIVKDYYGNADASNITVLPSGGKTIDNGGSSYTMTLNFGSVTFIYLGVSNNWGSFSV